MLEALNNTTNPTAKDMHLLIMEFITEKGFFPNYKSFCQYLIDNQTIKPIQSFLKKDFKLYFKDVYEGKVIISPEVVELMLDINPGAEEL